MKKIDEIEKIYIGSDHGGFLLKEDIKNSEKIKGILKEKNVEIIDCGTFDNNRTDYSKYAIEVSKRIKKPSDFGILICKSGHGMNYVANKFENVRASICSSKESAKWAIEDDDLNIIIFAANTTSKDLAIGILQEAFNSEFKRGKYEERIIQAKEEIKKLKNLKNEERK